MARYPTAILMLLTVIRVNSAFAEDCESFNFDQPNEVERKIIDYLRHDWGYTLTKCRFIGDDSPAYYYESRKIFMRKEGICIFTKDKFVESRGEILLQSNTTDLGQSNFMSDENIVDEKCPSDDNNYIMTEYITPSTFILLKNSLNSIKNNPESERKIIILDRTEFDKSNLVDLMRNGELKSISIKYEYYANEYPGWMPLYSAEYNYKSKYYRISFDFTGDLLKIMNFSEFTLN